uniref:DUF4325 domain-containing protein n=1 Tax=Rhabditophanes sp. KR3021 TaxID=114890 RepID=A0AC35U2F8_9BILA
MKDYRIKQVEEHIKKLNVGDTLDPLFAGKLAKRLFGADFTAMSIEDATSFVLDHHIGYRQYDRFRNSFATLGYKIFPSALKMNAYKKSIENGTVKTDILTNSKKNLFK